MTRELIDLERIRRNWERVGASGSDPAPDRLTAVQAPIDPYEIGTELVSLMKREVFEQFPKHAEVLRPFVERADAIFTQMARQADPDATPATPSGADPAELRATFLAALRDLEDLCGVFAGMNR